MRIKVHLGTSVSFSSNLTPLFAICYQMRIYQKKTNRSYRSGADVGLSMLSGVKELKEGKHKNLSQAARAIGGKVK